MKLNICVAGATGWVGKPLCRAILDSDDLQLVGAVSRSRQGQPLKDVLEDSRSGLKVSGSVAEALEDANRCAWSISPVRRWSKPM